MASEQGAVVTIATRREERVLPVPYVVPCPLQSTHSWRCLKGGSSVALADLAVGVWFRLHAYPDRVAYRVDLPDRAVFVKQYRPRTIWGLFKDFWYRGRPQQAFVLGLQLPGLGVFTPEVLGLFGLGQPLVREMLLVNEWVADCQKWSDHLGGRAAKTHCPERYYAGIADIAELLGNLHRSGMYHGDLVTNLLMGRVGDEYRALLVDLEAIQRTAPVRRKRKNVLEVAHSSRRIPGLSTRDCRRFLGSYADAAGIDRAALRTLWRELSPVVEAQRRDRREGQQ